eukprot:CAMPEP_0197175556 /NCGR_PEP_ID=MMETSP1423-20130617/1745_1 /TAXON_ID=476441 /ORGANISM="Pseudo-nitzschia heimii, Strain UNC1101" /LENGTH=324 /DNA_ID=CAMNT_0042624743 /DNA_START=191 /DNA_END=1165 /DNA_ORIENTATION=+
MGNKIAEDACAATMSLTTTSPPKLFNSAFVFVKPHANTEKVRDLVTKKLESEGIAILSEKDIGGEEIDRQGLIDQHYYSIASKATILSAENIPVPRELFRQTFGEEWEKVLGDDRAANAVDACKRFKCTPEQLNEAWRKARAVKFGGGFYCARMSVNNKDELYVFNAFFMSMRSKFVGKENEIHCFEVEWDPNDLSWSSFRHDILGPTDPNNAPPNSIRRSILDQYKELGLSTEPNNSDNGVHASASPFEALAEKMNWLGIDSESDDLGKALLGAGISKARIEEWSRDPQIKLSNSVTGSVFDELEDLDISDCVKKLIELDSLN